MMERSEPVSPPAHLSAGWGLNLTARRRKRMFCCRLLRLITPFLALGGRNWPNAAGARSIGLADGNALAGAGMAGMVGDAGTGCRYYWR